MSDPSCPDDFTIDGDLFQVLINAEERYSLRPAARPGPEGWRQPGRVGPKAECLAYVEAHWLDMRPRARAKAWQKPPSPTAGNGMNALCTVAGRPRQ
jgi:MbtH protein